MVGYYVFIWIARQGFSALMVPGAFLGIGAGWAARGRSVPLGVVCGILALALGIFSEWRTAPFAADSSLAYFLTHLDKLQPITLIMIAVGSFFGYTSALRRV